MYNKYFVKENLYLYDDMNSELLSKINQWHLEIYFKNKLGNIKRKNSEKIIINSNENHIIVHITIQLQ